MVGLPVVDLAAAEVVASIRWPDLLRWIKIKTGRSAKAKSKGGWLIISTTLILMPTEVSRKKNIWQLWPDSVLQVADLVAVEVVADLAVKRVATDPDTDSLWMSEPQRKFNIVKSP